MEKQHLKRLGYGFSALVLSLSAVAWVPSTSVSATSACTSEEATITTLAGTVDVVCLSGDITVTDTIAINANTTIDLGGFSLTKGTGAVFTVADNVTLTITGNGRVIGVTSDTELVSLGAGANVSVEGGVYGYDVTPATNYTAYEIEEGVAWEVASTVKFKNLVASSVRKRRLGAGDSRPMGTYTQNVTVNGEAWLPSVVVTDDEDNAIEETDLKVTVASGRVTVYGYTAGTYKVTVTDATGTPVTATFTVYEFAEDTLNDDVYYVALGDILDLSDAYEASFAAGTPVPYAVSNSDDTKATVSSALVVTPVAVGSTDTTLTLSDSEENKMTFKVNVFSAEDQTINLASGDDFQYNESFANWSENITNTDADVATFAFEDGELTITAGDKAGTAEITLTDAEDETITKTITVNVYKLADSYTMEVNGGRVSETISDIVELPSDTWSVVVDDAVDADETYVYYSDGYYYAKEAGNRVFGYSIRNEANTEVGAGNVTIYVYDETNNENDISDTYVTISDGVLDDVRGLYATNGGVVTYTVDDEEADTETDNEITFTTTGEKTITFTEKLGNKVINTTEAKVYVTGVKAESASKLVGEDATLTIAPFMGTFKSETISTGLTVEKDGNEYTFSATEAGEYTYTVKIDEVSAVFGDATVNVAHDYDYELKFYAPMTVETEGILDLNEESADKEITITASADEGTVTVADENETATGLEIIDNGDGTWTVMAGTAAEGTYALTATHTATDDTVLEVTEIEIEVIDTTETEEPVTPTFEETVLAKVMAAGDSITVEAEAGANVKVFDLSTYDGEIPEEVTGIAAYEDYYEFADESDITVEETSEGIYTIEALKAGVYYINIEKQDEEGNIIVTNVTLMVTSTTAGAAETVTDILEQYADAYNENAQAFIEYFEAIAAEYDSEEDRAVAIAEAEAKVTAALEALGKASLATENAFGDSAEAIMEAVSEGKTISTDVSVEAIEEIDASVEEAILAKLDADYAGNVSYYDIDVNVYADGVKIGTLSELSNEQTIVISGLEGAEAGYTRTYKVVRYHTYIDENGDEQVAVDVIEDVTFDEAAGTLTFKSDKFSTYAVAYNDTLSATTNTGAATNGSTSASANVSMAVITAIAAIALGGAAVFAKRK